VREVLKPLESWGVNNHTYDASSAGHFDFLLEGVPNLVANQEEANYLAKLSCCSDTLDKVDMRQLTIAHRARGVNSLGKRDRANRSASAFAR